MADHSITHFSMCNSCQNRLAFLLCLMKARSHRADDQRITSSKREADNFEFNSMIEANIYFDQFLHVLFGQLPVDVELIVRVQDYGFNLDRMKFSRKSIFTWIACAVTKTKSTYNKCYKSFRYDLAFGRTFLYYFADNIFYNCFCLCPRHCVWRGLFWSKKAIHFNSSWKRKKGEIE